MKKLILLAIVALTTFSATAELKIGVVNMQKAFEAYHKTVASKKVLQAKEVELKEKTQTAMKSKEAVIEGILKSAGVDVANEKFNSPQQILDRINGHAVWSKAKKAKSVVAVRQALQQMKDVQQGFQNAVRMEQKKLSELRNKLLTEIRGQLEASAKSKGFDIVLDSSEVTVSRVPAVLFAKPSMDITDKFIAFLNEGQTVKK